MSTCLGVLFIKFTVCVFRERLSVCVCVSFPLGISMWGLIVSIPYYCLSFFFASYFSRTLNVLYMEDYLIILTIF